MKFVAPLSFIFLVSLTTYASGLHCERLFTTHLEVDQMQKIAQNLALFRRSIFSTKSQSKKSLQLQEFNLKMEEFLQRSGNRERAYQLFTDALQDLYEVQPLSDQDEKRLNKNKTDIAEQEVAKLNEWKKYTILPVFPGIDIQQIAYNKDGSILVIRARDKNAMGGPVKIFDAKTMKELQLAFPILPNATNFSISENGERLLIVGPGFAQLIDLVNHHELKIPELNAAQNYRGALSSDGSQLIVSSYEGNAVVFDVHSKQKIDVSSRASGAYPMFSPDGSKVIQLLRSTIKISDLKNPKIPMFSANLGPQVQNHFFLPDGKSLVMALNNGDLRLFDIETKISTPIKTGLSDMDHMTSWIGSDGPEVILQDGKTAIHMNLNSKKTFTIPIKDLEWFGKPTASADGARVMFSGFRGAVAFDLDTGQEVIPFKTTHVLKQTAACPDGSKIAVTDDKGNVWIWFREAKEARNLEVKP